jgi:hypothetical protein
MCDPTTAVEKPVPVEEGTSSSMTKPSSAVDNKYKIVAFVLGLTTIAFLISTIGSIREKIGDLAGELGGGSSMTDNDAPPHE